jgi:uncharacterized protein (TIGR03083 family)
MSTRATANLDAAVATEFVALADLLDSLPDSRWDAPSLCAGWRVREVVAHLTMRVRYTPDEFQAELQDCGCDFTELSNRVAARDARLPIRTLLGDLRDDAMHQWTPPGGGRIGALTRVVIHGLDITVPLGYGPHSPDDALRAVLDNLSDGGTHAHFGVDLDGVQLRAADMEWSFGWGETVSGAAEDLALGLCGRRLPAGRIDGDFPRTRSTV